MTEAHPPEAVVERRPIGPEGPLCKCVQRHRPRPYEDEGHHVIPVGQPFLGDPDGEKVWLCPTTHSAVHGAIRRLLANKNAKRGRITIYAWMLAQRAIADLAKEPPPWRRQRDR